jgi:K+-transporting ATPase ATPase C chain
MKTLFRQALAGLRVLLVLTVILGVLYPLAVWGISRIPWFESKAEGSLLSAGDQVVGSALVGVDPVAADPQHDPWFHTRPSATAKDVLGPGDPSTSGASNKGPNNPDLVAQIAQRKDLIAARENVTPAQVPADAVTASGSGVDPSISVAYANLQIPRVARVTGLSEDRVRGLVRDHTTGEGIGIPGVNVGELNLAIQSAR